MENKYLDAVIDYTPLELMIEELKIKFVNYEERDEQLTMWRATYKAMLTGAQLAIHAPTGTGKSLGYIIPAMAVKLIKPDFKVTFSTYTLALQEQLVKDLELGLELLDNVKKKNSKYMIGKRATYVMLKGTKNYFCRSRLDLAMDVISNTKRNQLIQKTSSGVAWDRQSLDMDFSFKEWDAINVQSCTRQNCPFSDSCTYFNAYDGFAKHDFFILNHSLFLIRYFFVEKWEDISFFVFDEAHKLEKNLLDTYTFQINKNLINTWKEIALAIAKKYDLPNEALTMWVDKYFGMHNTTLNEFYRFLEEVGMGLPVESIKLEKTTIKKEKIADITSKLIDWMKDMFFSFDSFVVKPNYVNKPPEVLQTELNNWVKSLMDLKEFSSVAFNSHDLGQIWFELNYKKELTILATPKNTKYVPSVFENRGALVTSGTLAENGTCKGFADRLRMTLADDIVLRSPFYLQDQTIVYVSKNVSPKSQNYQQELEYEIMELLKAGRQKTFVLFTSSKMMKDVYQNLAPKIREMETYKDQDIEIWVQEKGNNKRVIASFKDESVRSVLFGTLSYFEGIDLKGETLTQIILTRLPFSVPTHPVQEILDANSSYSQWEAVVRYEQAFGRLIRTEFDYGAFCLLDNRVSYMRHFVSLFEAEDIPITSDLSDIERFFDTQS